MHLCPKRLWRRYLQPVTNSGARPRTSVVLEGRVSQLVTRLEKLGLVRKERFERTNKLFVTGEVREI